MESTIKPLDFSLRYAPFRMTRRNAHPSYPPLPRHSRERGNPDLKCAFNVRNANHPPSVPVIPSAARNPKAPIPQPTPVTQAAFPPIPAHSPVIPANAGILTSNARSTFVTPTIHLLCLSPVIPAFRFFTALRSVQNDKACPPVISASPPRPPTRHSRETRES